MLVNEPVRVVCSSDNRDASWTWLKKQMSGDNVQFELFDATRPTFLERKIQRPFLARYGACWRAAGRARSADLLVSFGPLVTCWTELAARVRGKLPHHLAFGFNFTTLPQGARLELMRKGLRHVDRFVVASSVEAKLYADYFDLDVNRFDLLLWGIDIQERDTGNAPNLLGDYVYALGGEGRDYRTLFEAARLLPQVRIVVVARPYSIEGLDVPDNVLLKTNIPTSEAWHLLKHSRFSVVPLRDSEVPCGHVTLVASMHCARGLVVTDSAGVADYVRAEDNALLVSPKDPRALSMAIQRLWEDPELSAQLGARGAEFARERCSEECTISYVRKYLRQFRA